MRHEIPAVDYLHTFMVGLLFLDANGFDVSERAAILSTIGKRQIADEEGLSTITEVGNSYKFKVLKASMIAQWSDYSIIERDKKRAVSHGAGKGSSSYTPHRRRGPSKRSSSTTSRTTRTTTTSGLTTSRP